MDIRNFISKSDIKGVLCLEHASRLLNLSTFPPVPVIIFQEVDRDYDLSYFKIVSQKPLDLRHTEEISDNLFVTNRERTIIDLVKYDREERFIYESIETYLIKSSPEELISVASEFGLEHEVYDRLDTLDEWLREFYEH